MDTEGGRERATLEVAMRDADEVMRAHPRFHLPLAERAKLWMAMGPHSFQPGYRADVTSALRRRHLLCAMSVERALPVWDELVAAHGTFLRSEDGPREILALSAPRLGGQGWDEAWQAARRFPTLLQYASEVPPELARAFLVVHAAIDTLFVVLKDLPAPDEETRDEDRDAWDAPFYACWAVCGGVPWDNPNARQDASRRAFWSWFIHDACPAAFGAFAD